MNKLLKHFWNDELGSAVVDWCILGGGAVSLGVAIVSTIV